MPDDKKSIRITIDQIDETLQQNVDLGDAARAAGVDVFLQLTQARDANLVREFSRLRQNPPCQRPSPGWPDDAPGCEYRVTPESSLRCPPQWDRHTVTGS